MRFIIHETVIDYQVNPASDEKDIYVISKMLWLVLQVTIIVRYFIYYEAHQYISSKDVPQADNRNINNRVCNSNRDLFTDLSKTVV